MDKLFDHTICIFIVLIFGGRVVAEVSQSELIDKLLDSKFYNKRERPGVKLKIPTLITIDVFVNMISDISEKNMDFTTDLYFRQRWKDDRLQFTEFNNTLTLGYTRAEQIWVPDTFFPNLKNGFMHQLTAPNILLALSPDGSIFMSLSNNDLQSQLEKNWINHPIICSQFQQVKATSRPVHTGRDWAHLQETSLSLVFACYMELHNFPLDEQQCRLNFMSYGHTIEDIIISWEQHPSNFSLNQQIKLPDFLVSGYSLGDCTEKFATGTFGCVFAELTFTRQFGYYLTVTYLPTLLIVVLSWVGFWIDYKSTPSRISLGLLNVLAITTQTYGTNAGLPRVSYVKSIDVWMAISMIFVAGALLEFAVVNVIDRKQTEGLSTRKETKRLARIKKLMTVSTQELVVKSHWDVDEPRADINYKDLNRPALATNHTTSGPVPSPQTQRNYALLIDKASRVIFPTLFILTSTIYALSLRLYSQKE